MIPFPLRFPCPLGFILEECSNILIKFMATSFITVTYPGNKTFLYLYGWTLRNTKNISKSLQVNISYSVFHFLLINYTYNKSYRNIKYKALQFKMQDYYLKSNWHSIHLLNTAIQNHTLNKNSIKFILNASISIHCTLLYVFFANLYIILPYWLNYKMRLFSL
jgi:hypothetical protein